MLRRLAVFLLPVLIISAVSSAQEKWDLRKCVEYAIQNNISVKQADLQIRFAELDKKQSKLSQYPSATFNSNLINSGGRNQDPTSFNLITTGYITNSYSLQTSVDLFNWFTKKNTVVLRGINLQAAEAGFDKAKNDISLNVAVAYLQILLAKEEVNLSKVQVGQTAAQLDNTQKQVDAGNLPELSAAQLESQLATDSSNLITAQTNVQTLLLQMKALLNLDAALPFDVDAPPVDKIPVESLADLQPDAVYALALINQPQSKLDILNLKAAEKSVDIARGGMYPTLSLFASLGSTFNDKAKEIKSKTTSSGPIGAVTVGATTYSVYTVTPFDILNYGKQGYYKQLSQNFRQSIGIGISVPILNGGVYRTAWERSKLSVKQVQLQNTQNNLTLKQDIYKAYNDAVAAVQKFNASKKSVETAQKAYDFARKRYDLNLLSTYELLNTQNALLNAKTQLLSVQYDYVFKLKLLEFHRGQGLKL